MKKYLQYFLVISIFPLALFTCSLVSAQSHHLSDEYFSKALDLKDQGKYLEAAMMYEKSAQAEKASPSPIMAEVSVELNEAGYHYSFVGQYKNAIKNYKEALVIARKLDRKDYISAYLNNIGRVYNSRGQYDKAIKCYEEALAINKKLQRKADIAGVLNNIGMVYDSWGQYDKAKEYYEEALAIARKLELKELIATSLNNIGTVYDIWGKYYIAIELYKEALTINEKLQREAKIAACLNNIGEAYISLGEHDKAIEYHEEALAIARKLELKELITTSLNNIGTVYSSKGQYDKAMKCYKEDLAINEKSQRKADIVINLNNIANLYFKQKKIKMSIEYLEKSVSIQEKLRKTADGDVRRDYLASQLDTYQFLVSDYITDLNITSAFHTIELSRAKLLAERLAVDESKIKIPELKQIQESLDKDTVILVYANIIREKIVQIAITREEIEGKEMSCKDFVKSSLDKYRTPIGALSVIQRNLNEGSLIADIINYYRSLLRGERDLEKNLRESPEIMKANTRELGRGLYDLLIKPMEAQLKNKTNLIIVPDGILSFVPFETLIDEKGRYLVENYNISYIQSMGIRKLIKERKYREDRKPLLAFGGAVYDEKTYNKDMKMRKRMNATQLASLKKQIYSDIERKKSVRDAYSALGIDTWTNLPGTLREVDKIKQVIKRSDIFRDVNVTERNVKEFSRNGTLSRYKVVHFATHGLIVPEVPELSAVVLSQFKDNTGKEDGYLRMGEIAELDIRADFVNLSACETGLGKIYGGEGVVGLTQSFILAGANAVSVSLWSVADKSTSLFMVATYNMVHNYNLSYADAMTEVKRQFIKGEFGETYKKPYYWAPFVYYGN